MPTNDSTTRFSAYGPTVFERRERGGVRWPIASTLGDDGRARRIADALNAAEENRDRPWEGEGPSVAEAGGKSILVRGFNGDLHRSVYVEGVGWTGMLLAPTGWRPMPKPETPSLGEALDIVLGDVPEE